jgi:hypothetical protein
MTAPHETDATALFDDLLQRSFTLRAEGNERSDTSPGPLVPTPPDTPDAEKRGRGPEFGEAVGGQDGERN